MQRFYIIEANTAIWGLIEALNALSNSERVVYIEPVIIVDNGKSTSGYRAIIERKSDAQKS